MEARSTAARLERLATSALGLREVTVNCAPPCPLTHNEYVPDTVSLTFTTARLDVATIVSLLRGVREYVDACGNSMRATAAPRVAAPTRANLIARILHRVVQRPRKAAGTLCDSGDVYAEYRSLSPEEKLVRLIRQSIVTVPTRRDDRGRVGVIVHVRAALRDDELKVYAPSGHGARLDKMYSHDKTCVAAFKTIVSRALGIANTSFGLGAMNDSQTPVTSVALDMCAGDVLATFYDGASVKGLFLRDLVNACKALPDFFPRTARRDSYTCIYIAGTRLAIDASGAEP